MSAETRLCTASQFFTDEDEGTSSKSTNERVVELLNQAALFQKDSQRINNLKIVQELIIHKDSTLLDSFLDEMLAFQHDRSQDVKKFVVGFIEEASKRDPEVLPKVLGNLSILLQDDNVAVSKKVILTLTQLYKLALQWVAKAKTVSEEMEQSWGHMKTMKAHIIELLDSENDGVRTHAVKFVESIAIALTKKTPDSEVPKRCEGDISLDQIPDPHPLLSYKKLEDEGKKAVDALLKFMGSPHISSVNLMTCMGSLTNFAKQRPGFIQRVVQAYEALHVNLPPTLAKSQVSSVRKNLKMQMLAMLKHPSSTDMHPQITTLLTDLGATQAEVMRNMPKVDESRKRKIPSSASGSKKAKVELIPIDKDDEDEEVPPPRKSSRAKAAPTEDQQQSAIDVTASDLVSRLSPQNVADLVLLSMVMLPETMPASFQATYTPIAAAGTQAQIKHLSRLLATQLTVAGLGKGYHEVQSKPKPPPPPEDDEVKEPPPKQAIPVLGTPAAEFKPVVAPPQPVPPPAPFQLPPSTRKGIKVFKLSMVTQPMEQTAMDAMAVDSFNRVIKAEKDAIHGDVVETRLKMLTTLVPLYGGMLKDELLQYIFADLRNRTDLALAWVYQEYANYQGYNSSVPTDAKTNIASYDECLTRLLTGLLERPDQKEGLFSRLLLEAPLITHNAIMVLRKYCQEENRIFFGMSTLRDLILKRPAMKLDFLDVLLDFTSHEKVEVRQNAIRVAKRLHQMPEFTKAIEKSALYYLKFLLNSKPPAELFAHSRTKSELPDAWNEDTIKLCLYLYLGLLPVNHALIHELASVYTGTSADIKRTVLRVLEAPVKGMGMQSPELLTLVESCPKGSETLVTRIIHILTDKTSPSPELVERVRDLYQKRVSDVRFLIPVLNGLTKNEVIVALPKLIKLNPVVVREVFNRLLSSSTDSAFMSPLTPAELLIALHNIDSTKCDMKTIIRATNLCFAEKPSYTQEVLAVVMQTLMEQNPLPTLFMRTVIQSLAMYPELIGLVMNILQRLITKQVWKQKKVWEGFVKCCQRTQPQSYQVLLQLPAPQLKSAFEICPDLREPLLYHINSFTPHQRAHIPKTIINVLEKDPVEEQRTLDRARKEEEERIAEQERIYQMKLDEERQRQLAQQQLQQQQQQQQNSQANQENIVPIKVESETPEEAAAAAAASLQPSLVKIKEEPVETDMSPVAKVSTEVKQESPSSEARESRSRSRRSSARDSSPKRRSSRTKK